MTPAEPMAQRMPPVAAPRSQVAQPPVTPPPAVPAPAAMVPPPPPPAPPPPEPEPEPELELDTSPSFEPIELPAEEPGEETVLAPLHEFVPPAEATGHRAAPAVAPLVAVVVAQAAPLAPAAVPQGGAGVIAGHLSAVSTPDGGEAALRAALSSASREVIERIVWEVVPQLAETIIRENLDRLVKAR